jgi:hypothetical protein
MSVDGDGEDGDRRIEGIVSFVAVDPKENEEGSGDLVAEAEGEVEP